MNEEDIQRCLSFSDEYINNLDSCHDLRKILAAFEDKHREVTNFAERLNEKKIKINLNVTQYEQKRNDMEKLIMKQRTNYEIICARETQVQDKLLNLKLKYPIKQVSALVKNEMSKLAEVKTENLQEELANLKAKEIMLKEKKLILEAEIEKNQTRIDDYIKQFLE